MERDYECEAAAQIGRNMSNLMDSTLLECYNTMIVLAKNFMHVRQQHVTVQSWINDQVRGNYSYR